LAALAFRLLACWPAGLLCCCCAAAPTICAPARHCSRSSAPSAANIAFFLQGYSVLRQIRENFFPHKSFEVLIGTFAGSWMGAPGISAFYGLRPKKPKKPSFFCAHLLWAWGEKYYFIFTSFLLPIFPQPKKEFTQNFWVFWVFWVYAFVIY
jgi:hypothetical protein